MTGSGWSGLLPGRRVSDDMRGFALGYHALMIEDSEVFQRVIGDILAATPGIDSVVCAPTGKEGLDRLASGRFDVLFLDMVLPDMGGLDVLRRLRMWPSSPPVVVVSAAVGAGSNLAIRALQAGAFEVVCKPHPGQSSDPVGMLRGELHRVVEALQGRRQGHSFNIQPPPLERKAANPDRRAIPGRIHRPTWITAIAVSTGGPDALSRVVPLLPSHLPNPVFIVQHMPSGFTASLASSLNARSALDVVEARDGEDLRSGRVYIAPGGCHSIIRREGGSSIVRLIEAGHEAGIRPSADLLFRSLAAIPDPRGVLAVVMTGMGVDGTQGCRELKRTGSICLAQSEESCVVYGMPRSVVEAELADEVVALDFLARRIRDLQPASSRIEQPLRN